MTFTTDLVEGYLKRPTKCFLLSLTFLDYDGVAWNNNAERAIKAFERVRRFVDGRFAEQSIREYLVMLSVVKTCRYQNIDLLRFLLAKADHSSAYQLTLQWWS